MVPMIKSIELKLSDTTSETMPMLTAAHWEHNAQLAYGKGENMFKERFTLISRIGLIQGHGSSELS